jgi:hypothetical protein
MRTASITIQRPLPVAEPAPAAALGELAALVFGAIGFVVTRVLRRAGAT